jgi:hypothetical protein
MIWRLELSIASQSHCFFAFCFTKVHISSASASTRDGLPVRSWVFPGNTVDATTVAQGKEGLRGWRLGQAIFVGDAGMDSEANRQELARGLGHYILAMPMGKLTEVQREVLSRPGRFQQVNDHLEVKR